MPPQQEQQPNKYSFTKPVSLVGPTDADLQRNNELDKVRLLVCLFLIRFISSHIRFV